MDDTWTFLTAVQNGEIAIDSHERMAHIAFIYLYIVREEEMVFDAVDELHKHGWSFGQGDLRFNR